MKLKYPAIFAILAILIAMAVSGCTTSSPAATTTPGGATATPGGQATATPSPSGSLSTLASAMDLSQVHWYEYQMTTTGGEASSKMTMRVDNKVNYDGKIANKFTINVDTVEDGETTSMVTEAYSDIDGNSLGGHMKTMQNGQVIFEMDIPASQSSGSSGSSGQTDLISANDDAALTSLGADVVTVPAGTYACTKYTYASSDSTGTVWVAPNVPLPVKVEGKADSVTSTMELVGWG